jgi:polysaccharide biosynthesis protein PslH
VPLKILFLTHRIPYPLTDGGAMVSDFMLTGFLDHLIELSIISLNTSKHFVDVDTLPDYYKKLQHFDTVNINNDITISGAIHNLFTTESFHTARFKSDELNTKIKLLLSNQPFDFVVLDNIFLQDTIATIRKCSSAKIACRIHNIEHLIWKKLANHSNHIIKKKYLKIQAQRLQKIELQTLENVDLLLLLNNDEGEVLKKMNIKTPQYLMPFGIDFGVAINNHVALTPNTCFHLASMNWMPNVEALDWFLEKVFPLVVEKNNDFVLHIGGKYLPDKYLKITNKNIVVHTKVENAKQFMQQYGICIVPLLSGAGIRVKILEAMSLGIPIISTTLGASGLDILSQYDIIIKDTPIAFANAILLDNNVLKEIGRNAYETAMLKYQKTKIIVETKTYLNLFLNV